MGPEPDRPWASTLETLGDIEAAATCTIPTWTKRRRGGRSGCEFCHDLITALPRQRMQCGLFSNTPLNTVGRNEG